MKTIVNRTTHKQPENFFLTGNLVEGNSGLIVLISGKGSTSSTFKGTVLNIINTDHLINYPIGVHRTDWVKNTFHLFNGSIDCVQIK